MRRRLGGENDMSSLKPAGSLLGLLDSVEGCNGSLVVEELKFCADGHPIMLCVFSAV
jgi:hypothetical protein